MIRATTLALAASGLALLSSAGHSRDAEPSDALAALRARPPEQDVIYFVLPDRFENGDPANDRGGYAGDRLATGFDPADKGFYHGGDLAGLTSRLDYIQGLGATAIWVGPVFRNKPVQGASGQESAGYHGYWITDFTTVDPHLGTEAEFAAFVNAAHARGMKVYMDIIINHTADVITYADGDESGYAYRSKAAYPFSTRGAARGTPINPGFAGDHDRAPANWAKLTDPGFAYAPRVPESERAAKTPKWLNDPIYYHNRGDTDWTGESAQYGDFIGLDDLATEHPRVVEGMIEIYGAWIERYGIDGFRIDTARHVNAEFWQAFVPAMEERARQAGIPNFHIFGEVATERYDPALLASWTHAAQFPAVLDFGLMYAVIHALSAGGGQAELARMPMDDTLYAGGASAANRLPTFLGNHDAGRIAMLLEKANPGISREELLARVKLAHALLLSLRGVPTIYAGDEQGFVGTGGDKEARQDMFASQVTAFNTQDLLGSDATSAEANFDTTHPLYRVISQLAQLRARTPALQSGATRLRAASETAPGLFALSRFDPRDSHEIVMVFNTSGQALEAMVAVDPNSVQFREVAGHGCATKSIAAGSLPITLAPFGFALCEALR
ncbi:alpha-amylase family glycosyl hydrolase [Novosphingobium mangrovi (ex Hu et al. 2023)]|uniref:Alpha-amylase family glycosyl hydrolase n=1 Tax=Novosphingobium mangrovi (ex Hu et al. 2023) TaxID=2930094 RepID=A0ABT0AHT8_9SPHN|nr:alpha-amylase family glycosyl hydrolase [Novosphingobium mangrovi (ex Hu et al. 2023)]MCJ1962769.1 alpha-amylase family glycosyl hydrolase [Novosphingobium mangrovi (ex Hu et al. 2023)]